LLKEAGVIGTDTARSGLASHSMMRSYHNRNANISRNSGRIKLFNQNGKTNISSGLSVSINASEVANKLEERSVISHKKINIKDKE
jgi:hypothetical protein